MVEFTADYSQVCMYAVYRINSCMTPEKMAAKCGHAFRLAMGRPRKAKPDVSTNYKGTGKRIHQTMHYGLNKKQQKT